MTIRRSISIRGRVQGVGFRYFARDLALQKGLVGWVRNTGDMIVEVEVEGAVVDLELFLVELERGPPLSHVADFEIHDIPILAFESDFLITH